MSCCNGGCCAVFTYPSTPAEIRERLARGEGFRDDPMLADMLIPLTPEQARDRCDEFNLRLDTRSTEPWGQVPHYTCKHWDETTRLCTVYESRPTMCRDYPYGRGCQHGCGFNNADDRTVIDRYKVVTKPDDRAVVQGGDAHAEQAE